jgi:hypothetical protein
MELTKDQISGGHQIQEETWLLKATKGALTHSAVIEWKWGPSWPHLYPVAGSLYSTD